MATGYLKAVSLPSDKFDNTYTPLWFWNARATETGVPAAIKQSTTNITRRTCIITPALWRTMRRASRMILTTGRTGAIPARAAAGYIRAATPTMIRMKTETASIRMIKTEISAPDTGSVTVRGTVLRIRSMSVPDILYLRRRLYRDCLMRD